MDRQIWDSEQQLSVENFISELQKELSGNAIPEKKSREIKELIYIQKTDYHSLQTIMGILNSISRTGLNVSLGRLYNKLNF
ncbi:MAG: hypothetical protein K0R36_917 [Chryseobacterium sp.]|jgi:hypothetical protein|nr:hypothetical protein [Chryseobacterium sp.]